MYTPVWRLLPRHRPQGTISVLLTALCQPCCEPHRAPSCLLPPHHHLLPPTFSDLTPPSSLLHAPFSVLPSPLPPSEYSLLPSPPPSSLPPPPSHRILPPHLRSPLLTPSHCCPPLLGEFSWPLPLTLLDSKGLVLSTIWKSQSNGTQASREGIPPALVTLLPPPLKAADCGSTHSVPSSDLSLLRLPLLLPHSSPSPEPL